jgi:hypothetical protein
VDATMLDVIKMEVTAGISVYALTMIVVVYMVENNTPSYSESNVTTY